MNIRELFESYCEKEDGRYVTNFHSVDIIPATEDQINTLIRNCKEHSVNENIVSVISRHRENAYLVFCKN